MGDTAEWVPSLHILSQLFIKNSGRARESLIASREVKNLASGTFSSMEQREKPLFWGGGQDRELLRPPKKAKGSMKRDPPSSSPPNPFQPH